jgi:hypothetical protein
VEPYAVQAMIYHYARRKRHFVLPSLFYANLLKARADESVAVQNYVAGRVHMGMSNIGKNSNDSSKMGVHQTRALGC